MVTLISTPTVDPTNQDAPKPSSQVKAIRLHRQMLTQLSTLTCSAQVHLLLLQVNLTLCATTSALLQRQPVERCSSEAWTDEGLLQHHRHPALPEVDMVTWNQYLRWGVVYIRLHSGRNFTEARIDHKLLRFEQYTSTRLLAQFDEDLQQVQKISLRINTGNIIGPRYKIRLLRIRFTPLERPDRSEVTGFYSLFYIWSPNRPVLCRFDVIMEENMEVAFRPLPYESSYKSRYPSEEGCSCRSNITAAASCYPTTQQGSISH
ncbi:hypothetical protein XENOCAPTIV_027168 [Xenoophorus captivus]|uniref:Uncharacterized protein n=1 Tax=Xenoophorus captivus TaxID=1517983 RepID=A0ABV0RFJ6_9TELE